MDARHSVRTNSTSKEKAVAFARAYQRLKSYLDGGDYLAAYVLSFSIVEDRLRAMYVVRHRVETGQDPSERKIHQSLVSIVRYLSAREDLAEELKDQLILTARARNQMVHAAMWLLDETAEHDINELIRLGRALDGARRRQKRKLGE
jgi:hypothetical protein